LRGSQIGWQPEAALLVFDPPDLEDATVLVLAPHPDDAQIASFGVYANSRSWVVTVTAGERATGLLPSAIPGAVRSHWAAWLRSWDTLSAPDLGNVPPERRLSLSYPDGALESMYREQGRSFSLACEASLPRSSLRARNPVPHFQRCAAQCTWEGLVGEVRELLELTQPDIVICPHPLVDSHTDHVFTTVALEQALQDWRGRMPKVFLYVVHSSASSLYPLGPAESLVGLSPGRYAGWAADCLYSHPLDSETQAAKYFAVEAMHAARTCCADTQSIGFGGLVRSLRHELSAYLSGMAVSPGSLLRRAPRPNEVYYVIRGAMLGKMTQQALDARRMAESA